MCTRQYCCNEKSEEVRCWKERKEGVKDKEEKQIWLREEMTEKLKEEER